MRKTKTLALLFAALAMGGASAARADVTAITVTTSNPRIGLLIQATASNDGNPPPVVAWESWQRRLAVGFDITSRFDDVRGACTGRIYDRRQGDLRRTQPSATQDR